MRNLRTTRHPASLPSLSGGHWLVLGLLALAGCDCGGDDDRALGADSAAPSAFLAEPESPAAREPIAALELVIVDPVRDGEKTSGVDDDHLVATLDGEEITESLDISRVDDAVVPTGPRESDDGPDEDSGDEPESDEGDHGPALRLRYELDEPIADRAVALSLDFRDRAGNQGELELELVVDTAPPEVEAKAPADGDVLDDPRTDLTYRVEDTLSGLDEDALVVKVSGAKIKHALEGDTLTVSAPKDGWAPGPLRVDVEAADRAGNTVMATFLYTVQRSLLARPRAIPTSGDAPLNVRFSPIADSPTAIESYEWDFDGDGTFDRTDTVGRDQNFTFDEPGTYTTRLRLLQADGAEAEGTVAITVRNDLPVIFAEANPSNGAPPLDVAFTARATDRDRIERYDWDLDGDGEYELMDAGTSPRFTYETAGTYQARVRAVDGRGAAEEYAGPTLEIRIAEGAPSVRATASVASGVVPLTVTLSATARSDEEIATWSWDFDGDGDYDDEGPELGQVDHEYTAAGTYYVGVRATTASGATGSDVVRIDLTADYSLTLNIDTVDVNRDEKVDIATVLGGGTRVRLQIETPDGEVVRELVPWEERKAGEHTDPWDGRDDAGEVVAEGEYRAILLYEVQGEERRLDLVDSSGGRETNPPRTDIPTTFAPLAGEPLVIEYTLERAAEVTAFIGRFDVNTRLITFAHRAVRGRGTHTIVWNGENYAGQLVHPPDGDSFLFGVFAYDLPDNAIFVRSGVHLSGVSVAPSVLNPVALNDAGKMETSTVRFSANRDGAGEFMVYDSTSGALMVHRVLEEVRAGTQSFKWDGRTLAGTPVAPGRYRIGVAGVDERGARSTLIFTMQRVFY